MVTGPVPDHPSARRVDAVLTQLGLQGRVRELPGSTRTASDAATAIGCEVRQIVKSLVFRTASSSRAILVLASGDHRVDEKWMARYAGEPLVRADPEFARSATGFAIGGVPPLGHPTALPTFIDYRLLAQSEVWAAAGTPNAVCRLTALELLRSTLGRAVPVEPTRRDRAPVGRWVTFDCYGTLVDWRSGLLHALEHNVPRISRGAGDRFFSTYLTEEKRLEEGPYRSYRETMAAALLASADREGLSMGRANAEAIVESIPEWPLFADTESALRTLRGRGVRLAVLSNIDRDLLDRTLSGHALEMSLSVSAEEVRSYKPAPAHWIRFLEESGTDPAGVWHVAGSFDYDIATANRLGFRTAFLTRYETAAVGEDASVIATGLDDFANRLAFPPEPATRPEGR